MRRTPEMERIEYRDWERRLEADPGAKRRDIRQIIQEAMDLTGNLDGASRLLGVHLTTLSIWISKNLGGDIQSRVVFPDPADDPTPLAAA